jgi:hypothetical protein
MLIFTIFSDKLFFNQHKLGLLSDGHKGHSLPIEAEGKLPPWRAEP